VPVLAGRFAAAGLQPAGLDAEGGCVAQALHRAGAQPHVRSGKAEPLEAVHGFVAGGEQQVIPLVHRELPRHRCGFGIAPVAQQQSAPAPFVPGNEAEHAFALMGFARFVPGHRAAPAHAAAAHQPGRVLAVQSGDSPQEGILGEQLHDLDERAAGLGTAVQQVVAAALGAPAPAAEPEETDGVGKGKAHGGAAGWREAQTMIASGDGVLAALAAALCWTLASVLWRRLPTSLGASELNLLKNLLALGLQLPLLLLPGSGAGLHRLPLSAALLLLASGALGIAAGDSLYFAALRRLGTRRALTFDAGGPAVTAAAGMVMLREVPLLHQWLGIGLISLAVLLVARQRPPTPLGVSSGMASRSDQRQGAGLALAALLCGSAGALLARAVLRDGGPSVLIAASLRLLGGTLVLLPLLPALLRSRGAAVAGPRPSSRRWPLVLVATLLGTAAGIALQQYALRTLPGGLAVALLATAPVLAVPLARWEGDRPGRAGVLAAGLSVLAVVLISRPG
jgi:DME family drug/metabolite transporter